jgi:hypothetical protein
MAGPWEKYAAPATPAGPWTKYAPLAQPKTFERDEDEALYREKLAKEQDARAKPMVPFYASEPGGAERNLAAERRAMSPQDAAVGDVQRQRAEEAEEKAFADSRTLGRRVADTATFIASMPVRMATRGEHGAGDVAEGLGFKSLGDALDEHEATFARANEDMLGLAQRGGEVMAGIPMLSTMGAVPGQMMRTTSYAAGPAARKIAPHQAANWLREKTGRQTQEWEPPSKPTRFERQTALNNERLADIEAFEGSGVKPFGPALTESGTAGVVKQLSDAPIVGAPVRRALGEAIEETRDAGERIASRYGDAKSYRDVGNVVEGGLDRFKDARAADLGEDAARALSDDQLASVARTPARETSIKTKQDALYERAWRGIPEDMQKGRSKKDADRFLGGMAKTREVLQELTERNSRMFAKTRGGEEVDPTLAYPLRGGVAGRIVEDVIEGRWRGNLQSMRDVRSNLRRLASGMTDTEKNTLQLSDMRRLQSAMTEDMIALLQRNAKHYADPKGGNDMATATRIRRAIHDFRRADQFTRASAQRLERIEKLYGAQSAEQLALNVAKDAMGGRKGGNYTRLLALKRSLKDEEWGDVASGVIRELGRPVASARGAAEEAGFSVQSFMTRWREMSEEGKGALFDREGLRPALDKFVRVADRMANFEAMANTSRSATNALGMTGLASIFTAAQQAMTGNLQTAAAAGSVALGTYAFGRFMTSPLYVRWLTRAAELSGDPGKLRSLRSHARELARLAAKEGDLPVQELLTALAQGVDQAASAQTQAQGPGSQQKSAGRAGRGEVPVSQQGL